MNPLSDRRRKMIGLREGIPTIHDVEPLGDMLGTRRVNVRVFSPDHQEAWKFACAMRIKAKQDPCACAREIVKYFNKEMVPHFAAEEKEARKVLYYPLYKRQAYALIEEHNRIREMVRFIAENCDSPQVGQMISRWCNAIQNHIIQEENGTLYAGADGSFPVKELEKTQMARLWSIGVFSPFLLYLAFRGKATPLQARLLVLAGVMTAITVGYAYYWNQKSLSE